MSKYFQAVSVKEEGNPKQDGTYCTNERQLQFKAGEWYDCGTEVCPPEFYFMPVSIADHISANKFLEEKGISTKQREMFLMSHVHINENAMQSHPIPLLSLMEEYTSLYCMRANEIKIPIDAEMKLEAGNFSEGQGESMSITPVGRRGAIAMGYYWGMEAMKNRIRPFILQTGNDGKVKQLLDVLIDYYEGRLKTVNESLSTNRNNGSIHDEKRNERLIVTASAFTTFVAELKTLIPHLNPEQSINTLEQLFERHKRFSFERFKESTAESSLKGLEREIKEIREETDRHKKGIEYIDGLFYWVDSFNRAGYSFYEMKCFMIEKLGINETREWNKNPDNSYSHKKNKLNRP